MINFTDVIKEKKEITLENKVKNFILSNIKFNEKDNTFNLTLDDLDKITEGVNHLIESKLFESSSSTFNYDFLSHKFKMFKVDKEKLKEANLDEQTLKDLKSELESSSGLLIIYKQSVNDANVYGAFTQNFLNKTITVPKNILIEI